MHRAATVTKGSQAATAKAAPAAAADTAVQAVWLVANSPWMRPTSDGRRPLGEQRLDRRHGGGEPKASVAPSTTRAGTLWMNG